MAPTAVMISKIKAAINFQSDAQSKAITSFLQASEISRVRGGTMK